MAGRRAVERRVQVGEVRGDQQQVGLGAVGRTAGSDGDVNDAAGVEPAECCTIEHVFESRLAHRQNCSTEAGAEVLRSGGGRPI
jgi:hypothetical protein